MSETALQMLLPDIPRIFTAMAEWLACLLCIMEMKRRFIGWKFVSACGLALVIQAVFLELTKGLENVLWILCMMAAVGLMYLFIFCCCEASAKDVGYMCVRAFVVAEFAASLEWQIDCYAYFMLGWTSQWFRLFWLIVVYGLVYTVVGVCFRKFAGAEGDLMVTNKELLPYVSIGLAVFAISNMGFVFGNTPFNGPYMIQIATVRTLIDFGGVAIIYAYHVQRMDLRVRHELESVQTILHNQYVQYQQSQEAMDIINYKYHDLKHHIMALRAEENQEKREAYLDQMEEEIRNYEAQNKTGNKVLDTLLTSKNLFCMKNHISMTSVVDGTLFDFMDVMDICSIFGNALDNAIECEKKIKDREKRLIHVSAFSQRNFLIIRFENYCENDLKFDAELPTTTKEDSQFHGYGLKSLRYTVRKYGGEVDINVQDNWFELKILIPMEMK